MTVINIRTIDSIEPYPASGESPGIRFRPARHAMEVSAWGMNIVELDPHCESYPLHDHVADGQEEVYVVLEGRAILHADDKSHSVAAGQMVRVAPEVKRRFVTHEDGVRLLALGGTPGHAYGSDVGD